VKWKADWLYHHDWLPAASAIAVAESTGVGDPSARYVHLSRPGPPGRNRHISSGIADVVAQLGDRLYVGTATGSIQVYSFEIPNESGSSIVPILKLLKTYAIGKRPIDQIGVLSESQKLAVLCGECAAF
jgi:hypothetical protein